MQFTKLMLAIKRKQYLRKLILKHKLFLKTETRLTFISFSLVIFDNKQTEFPDQSLSYKNNLTILRLVLKYLCKTIT